MNDTKNWLVHDHSQYEENLNLCREAINLADWDKAGSIFEGLARQLKLHMLQEEEEVYPTYAALVKISHDPTLTLRTEHNRIVSYVKDMQGFINTHDSTNGLECLQQLKDLISKHHEKEEDIFLPMSGYVINEKFEEVR